MNRKENGNNIIRPKDGNKAKQYICQTQTKIKTLRKYVIMWRRYRVLLLCQRHSLFGFYFLFYFGIFYSFHLQLLRQNESMAYTNLAASATLNYWLLKWYRQMMKWRHLKQCHEPWATSNQIPAANQKHETHITRIPTFIRFNGMDSVQQQEMKF